MKTKFMLAGFLFSFVVFSSCEKEEKPDDLRAKYVGKYQVHEKISSYGFPECGEPFSREKDTIISVIYGNTDSTLIVLDREVYLDSAGYYYDYHYGLRLWNDSIYSHFMNGGLGCGKNEVYEGYKISDKP